MNSISFAFPFNYPGTPPVKGGGGPAGGIRMTVPPPISASSMGVILPPDRKKRKLADKILAQKVRDLVPESQVRLDSRTTECQEGNGRRVVATLRLPMSRS